MLRVALCMAILCGAVVARADDGVNVAAAVDAILPSVVQVRAGKDRIGSGTVVHVRGYVVTASALVRGAGDVSVVVDGKPQAAVIVGDSDGVALLLVKDAPSLSAARFAVPPGKVLGHAVTLVSAGDAREGTVWPGIVAGVDRAWPAAPGSALVGLWQSDVARVPGALGAPVVDGSGNVVAAAIGLRSDATPGGVLLPAPRVQRALAAILDVPELGLSLQADEALRAVITNCKPGAPAHKAGVIAGGAIVEVGGVATPLFLDVLVALRDQKQQGRLAFDVKEMLPEGVVDTFHVQLAP